MKNHNFIVKPPRSIKQLTKLIKKVKPKSNVQAVVRDRRIKIDLEVKA